MKLIEVNNVKKYFPVQKGFLESLVSKDQSYVRAVDDITFTIERGEVLGLAGESGSR